MQEKGIQMTLFEYFQDAECFSLKEAVAFVEQGKEVKEPSIRARIYEGIEKGLFSRILSILIVCLIILCKYNCDILFFQHTIVGIKN